MKDLLDLISPYVRPYQIPNTANVSASNFISIPIKKDKILQILNRKKPREVEELYLQFEDERIIIKGIIKKLGLPIKFKLELLKTHVDGRKIFFEIIEFKPINNKWLNSLLLNRSPISLWRNTVIVDFNKIAKIRSIPIGKIKKIDIKDQTLWLGIGL